MTRVGILLINREYFVDYVNWVIDCHRNRKFELVGFHCDNFETYENKCDEFSQFKKLSFEEVVSSSDLVFSFGYWKKISKADIEKPKLGIINVHHSYRLRYRGRHMSTWVIRNEEKEHGSSIHYIDEYIDKGQIIETRKCDVNPDDTAFTLFQRVNAIGLDLLKNNVDQLLTKKVLSTEQLDPQAFSYKASDLSHEINKEVLRDETALYRHIRALTYPNAPKPYVMIAGKKVELSLAETE